MWIKDKAQGVTRWEETFVNGTRADAVTVANTIYAAQLAKYGNKYDLAVSFKLKNMDGGWRREAFRHVAEGPPPVWSVDGYETLINNPVLVKDSDLIVERVIIYRIAHMKSKY